MAIGPLAGVTVIDLTRVLAGPYCTMVLADLGARVIKVERPVTGDDARHIGPFTAGGSAYFASVNRGKESIDLDLRAADDRNVFETLLDRADVLVENYRPGALARLGYGWDVLHARWPRLVLASVSGFGQTGPLADRPAYDMVAQAMGGIMSITGEPGGGPTRVGTSLGDLAAGLFATVGILAALHERATTGVGAHVDVAMLDGQVALLENAIARYRTTGEVPGPIGNRHPSIAPFGVFRAADGHVVLAAGNDRLFGQLCEVLGVPGVAGDERFATNSLRCEHEAELRRRLEEALAKATVEVWLERLAAADLPCAPVLDVAQVLEHPQVQARGMVVPLDGAGFETLQVAGNPVRVSGHERPSMAPAPPGLGEHRAALLAELGLDLPA